MTAGVNVSGAAVGLRPPAARRSGLCFGRMLEDPAVEAMVFEPQARVFCVASAGCVAMALARRGHRVVAVDVNPAQVQYVRRRLEGGPVCDGLAERAMAVGRRALLSGRDPRLLREFLAMNSPEAQRAFADEHMNGWNWRAAVTMALHPLSLARSDRHAFVRTLPGGGEPGGFAELLRQRLRRGWSRHANAANPFAWHILRGTAGPNADHGGDYGCTGAASGRVEVLCAEAADYLENCPPASFDALSLSNILDGADDAQRARLLRAVERAARPRAVMVLRSFAEPTSEAQAHWAMIDRAWLWGSVEVRKVGSVDSEQVKRWTQWVPPGAMADDSLRR